MSIPCKNCLILPMCAGRLTNNPETSGWAVLYDSCETFKDHYNFYLSQMHQNEADKELKKIFGKKYKII